jgi:selenophosphate synthetase-related protein
VPLAQWLVTFPSFGFVLAAAPERAPEAIDAFARRGLACSACGAFDDSGVLRLAAGGDIADVWDLSVAPVTRPGPG